jgi:hypothetical protein
MKIALFELCVIVLIAFGAIQWLFPIIITKGL